MEAGSLAHCFDEMASEKLSQIKPPLVDVVLRSLDFCGSYLARVTQIFLDYTNITTIFL